MSLSTEIIAVNHTLATSPTASAPESITYPYPVNDTSHLIVYNGTTLQTISAQYTVTLAGDLKSATVKMISGTAGNTIVIVRIVPEKQDTVYTEGGKFPAKVHEIALDYARMVDQQIARRVKGAFRVPDSEDPQSDMELPAKTARASRSVVFDGAGDPAYRTAAERVNDLNLSSPSTLPTQQPKTWTSAADRATVVPDYLGQPGVQTNTNSQWISTGTTAGDWERAPKWGKDNIFYVDANNGSDTDNDGKSWEEPFATIDQALSSLSQYTAFPEPGIKVRGSSGANNPQWQEVISTAGAGGSVMTDSTGQWDVNELVGYMLFNVTNAQVDTITANTATTITTAANLSWKAGGGDRYRIHGTSNAAGIIFLAPGDYEIDKAIAPANDRNGSGGFWLIGSGTQFSQARSVIKPSAAYQAETPTYKSGPEAGRVPKWGGKFLLDIDCTGGASMHNVLIKNIHFQWWDETTSQPTSAALAEGGAANSQPYRGGLEGDYVNYCIRVEGGFNNVIKNCRFQYGKGGILYDGATSLTIQGCTGSSFSDRPRSVLATGTHGGGSSSVMTHDGTSPAWTVNEWIGYFLENEDFEPGSKLGFYGPITANTANTITATGPSGGDPSASWWDDGDRYNIRQGLTDTDPARGGLLVVTPFYGPHRVRMVNIECDSMQQLLDWNTRFTGTIVIDGVKSERGNGRTTTATGPTGEAGVRSNNDRQLQAVALIDTTEADTAPWKNNLTIRGVNWQQDATEFLGYNRYPLDVVRVINGGDPTVIIDGGQFRHENKSPTGTHDGNTGDYAHTSNLLTLVDTSQSFDIDEYVGQVITNTTDNSTGTVTSNTKHTITCSGGLTGGTDNDWDVGDAYSLDFLNVIHPVNWFRNTSTGKAYPYNQQISRFTNMTSSAAYHENQIRLDAPATISAQGRTSGGDPMENTLSSAGAPVEADNTDGHIHLSRDEVNQHTVRFNCGTRDVVLSGIAIVNIPQIENYLLTISEIGNSHGLIIQPEETNTLATSRFEFKGGSIYLRGGSVQMIYSTDLNRWTLVGARPYGHPGVLERALGLGPTWITDVTAEEVASGVIMIDPTATPCEIAGIDADAFGLDANVNSDDQTGAVSPIRNGARITIMNNHETNAVQINDDDATATDANDRFQLGGTASVTIPGYNTAGHGCMTFVYNGGVNATATGKWIKVI